MVFDRTKNSPVVRVIDAWASAWKACKNNALVVLFIALIDLGFFFVLGFATSYFVDQIILTAINLTQAISTQLQLENASGLFSVLFLPGVSGVTWQILGLMAITLVITYAVYVVVQGFAWHVTSGLMQTRMTRRYLDFVKRFSRFNVLWFVLFALFFLALTLVDLRYTIISSLASADKPIVPFVPLYVFLLAIVYGAFVSYGLDSWSQVKRAMMDKTVIVAFLSVVLALATLDVLVIGVRLLSPNVALLVALIALPLITVSRLVMMRVSRGVDGVR